ncbi:AraC family transcriptional regulator [Anaerobium acetethylicum]|uniref:AraC-type DNA-binding protein n=1 Tax=Anaerobium acetethylicum TaxID=1619234 RepID=A0A1D3TY33_9FIRM|nr:AraC family transcriptional regulator [Anaerobium acetethylicum]SCP99307.1 AraC-type DNA-binding protein [Anaerobium acetethylicum]
MKITKDDLELDKEYPFLISEQVLVSKDNCDDSFHWHSFFEITYIRSGRGSYYVNGRKYDVSEGDVIIFNNVEPHGWWVEDEEMHILVMVFSSELIAGRTSFFDSDYLQPFIERGSSFKNKIDKEDEITMEIGAVMSEISREWKGRKLGYQLMIKSDVLKILTLLIRYSQDDTKPQELLNEKKNAMKRLQDAFEYISSNYKNKVTLEEAAKAAYMSPNYFSSYFRRVTGVTFSEYLTDLRIRKAKELLRTTDLSTNEIANECGFGNMSNFYRLFKKQTGSTPKNRKSDTQ